MVKVQWGIGIGRRITGPYLWEKQNNWTQDVHPDDLLEILTNSGFRLAEQSNTEEVDGIGPATSEELLLAGVVTWDDLLAADADKLAAGLTNVGPATVRKWQESACQLKKEKDQGGNE